MKRTLRYFSKMNSISIFKCAFFNAHLSLVYTREGQTLVHYLTYSTSSYSLGSHLCATTGCYLSS